MSNNKVIAFPSFPPLYPKQHAAFYSDKRVVICEASTKAGKSVGGLRWLFDRGFHMGKETAHAWMAPINKSAMKIGYRGMVEFLEQWDISRTFWDEFKSEQEIILFSNKKSKKIHCRFVFFGSEDPDNVYGFEYSSAVVDEGSRCKEESWQALFTTTTFTEAPIRVIGNVKNKSTWMYKLGEKARKGSYLYDYHKITALDAVAAGVFPQSALDAARETLPDEVFERDYMAVPHDDAAAFFRSQTIEEQRSRFARPAERMRYDRTQKKLVADPGGKWHCWFDLPAVQEKVSGLDGRTGGGHPSGTPLPPRPGQVVPVFSARTNYALGVDISAGLAGSNSVVAVIDRSSGEIVAEYVDPHIAPEDLAELCVQVGRNVFGGQRGEAFICWEANGPGEGWFRHLIRQDYTNLMFQRREGSRGERRGRKYGWHSTRPLKIDRLGDLRAAMTKTADRKRRIVIHSDAGLDEMGRYVYLDDGSVGPDTTVDMVSGARAAHGDRVIAYMLCLVGFNEAHRYSKTQPVAKPGTFADRFGMKRFIKLDPWLEKTA